MKIRVAFTLDIDADAWAGEYNIPSFEVRKDVKEYVEHLAKAQIAGLGLLADERDNREWA